MSIRVDSSPLIANSFVIGESGHGVLAENIPSAGSSGPGYLFNDLDLPADNGKEVRGEIVAWPSSGTLAAHEDSSFEFSGAVDGNYSFDYQLYVDGVLTGSVTTVNLTVGNLPATVGSSQKPQNSVLSSTSSVPVLSGSLASMQAIQNVIANAESVVPVGAGAVIASQKPQVTQASGLQAVPVDSVTSYQAQQSSVLSALNTVPAITSSIESDQPAQQTQIYTGNSELTEPKNMMMIMSEDRYMQVLN